MNYRDMLESTYKEILDTSTRFEDDSNGPYREYCPFCGDNTPYRGKEPTPTMHDIEHYPTCLWVQANKYFNPEQYI